VARQGTPDSFSTCPTTRAMHVGPTFYPFDHTGGGLGHDRHSPTHANPAPKRRQFQQCDLEWSQTSGASISRPMQLWLTLTCHCADSALPNLQGAIMSGNLEAAKSPLQCTTQRKLNVTTYATLSRAHLKTPTYQERSRRKAKALYSSFSASRV
jgi:hypothetical protein